MAGAIQPSSLGYARGAGARPSSVAPFAAELHFDLSRIAAAVASLAGPQLQPLAETVVRQGLADMLAGIDRNAHTGLEVRVSVRDVNSCEACLELHGTVVRAGTEDYAAMRPPNHCKGGKRCRCEYTPVRRGASGFVYAGALTSSAPSAVTGELSATHTHDGEADSQEVRAAVAARFGPGPKLLRERERARLHHDLTETLRFQSLSTRVQREEAKRIIRQALTDGKPVLSSYMRTALAYLVRTGTVPSSIGNPPPVRV